MNIYEAFNKLKAEGGYITRDGIDYFYRFGEDEFLQEYSTTFNNWKDPECLMKSDCIADDWQHITELPTTN